MGLEHAVHVGTALAGHQFGVWHELAGHLFNALQTRVLLAGRQFGVQLELPEH